MSYHLLTLHVETPFKLGLAFVVGRRDSVKSGMFTRDVRYVKHSFVLTNKQFKLTRTQSKRVKYLMVFDSFSCTGRID